MSLADDLFTSALTLDDYASGAAFATDLVNTVEGLRAGDTLTNVDDLRALLLRHGSDTSAAAVSNEDVSEVRAVRARLLGVFEIMDDGRAVAALNALLEAPRHAVHVVEDRSGGEWRWAVAFGRDAALAERLQVISAVSLLGVVKALGADRFRPCASPDCSGVFVDTTRAGRRKYCQPARCGNRQNVAAHRARRSRGAARAV
jgi:predicted RNA-binding Zn ribbon-like protein